LTIDPAIPPAWDGFTVKRQWRGATYDIAVSNPNHVSKGVKAITLNGKAVREVAMQPSGTQNKVDVVLG
jgi:N,N'-diacetylchitobiose phosphorylase